MQLFTARHLTPLGPHSSRRSAELSSLNAVVELSPPSGRPVRIGNRERLAIIAGPCQLESRQHALETASALREIAQRDWDPTDRTVDVVIRRLRQKLHDDSRHPRLIVTSHGEGYLFSSPLEKP